MMRKLITTVNSKHDFTAAELAPKTTFNVTPVTLPPHQIIDPIIHGGVGGPKTTQF